MTEIAEKWNQIISKRQAEISVTFYAAEVRLTHRPIVVWNATHFISTVFWCHNMQQLCWLPDISLGWLATSQVIHWKSLLWTVPRSQEDRAIGIILSWVLTYIGPKHTYVSPIKSGQLWWRAWNRQFLQFSQPLDLSQHSRKIMETGFLAALRSGLLLVCGGVPE